MPASLHVSDLTVYRGPQLILDALSFQVDPRHRLGIESAPRAVRVIAAQQPAAAVV